MVRGCKGQKPSWGARRACGVLSLLGLWVGCEHSQLIGVEDKDSGVSRANAEAAVDQGTDADDASSADADATSADADANGQASDAATQTDADVGAQQSVVVRRGGAPVAGVRVYFHGAGVGRQEQQTGSDGRAATSASADQAITLVLPAPPGAPAVTTLLSYTGLRADEALIVELPEAPNAPVVGTYQVQWNGQGPFLTMQIGGCGGTPWTLDKPARIEQVAMTAACVERAKSALGTDEMDNDMGHHVLGFLSRASLPALAANPSVLTLDRTHEAQFVGLETTPLGGTWTRAEGFASGERFALPLHTALVSGTTPRVAFPAGFLDTLLLTAELKGDAGEPRAWAARSLARKFAPKAATQKLEFQDWLGELRFGRVQKTSSGFSKLTWEVKGGVTRGDQAEAHLEWPNGARWILVFPDGGTELILPTLPADLTPEPPASVRSLHVSDYVTLADAREARARPQRIARELWSEGWMQPVVEPQRDSLDPWDRSSWTSADDSAGASCNSLPEPRLRTPLQYATVPAPTATGGTIADGLYQLEQLVIHAAQAQTSIEARNELLEVRGPRWQRHAYWGVSPSLRSTHTVTLQSSDYTSSLSCGKAAATQLISVVPSDSGQYSATPELLSLIVPVTEPAGARAVFSYRRLLGDDPSCLYDCEAGVRYTSTGLGTGLYRMTIDKIDNARNRCTRIVLVGGASGSPAFSVSTPPALQLERAWMSSRAADCQDQGGVAPNAAIHASGGEGEIRAYSRNADGSCLLSANVDLYFEPGERDLPRQQRVASDAITAHCPPEPP